MKRPLVLLGLLWLSLGWTTRAETTAATGRPPNILFILADDLGWKDLGCQGSTFYETPNIDRLAAEGMRFTQAYAACPVCSPTRASLMTGKYPARLHLTDFLPGEKARPNQKLLGPSIIQNLPIDELTLPEALKRGGYVTGIIGKWHLGANAAHYPTSYGFDFNVAGCEMGHPYSYFSPYHIPTLTDGPKGEYLTDRLTSEAENSWRTTGTSRSFSTSRITPSIFRNRRSPG